MTSTTTHRRPRLAARRSGAATVELALTLPVMFTILMGMIDINMMIFHRQALTLAAYEGGRVASNRWTTNSDITTRGLQILDSRRITSASRSVTVSMPSSPTTGDSITVTVSAPFSGMMLQNFSVSAVAKVVRQ
jgi:Flp pilus assembly protein TadG